MAPAFDPRLAPVDPDGRDAFERPVPRERLDAGFLRQRLRVPVPWTPEATADRVMDRAIPAELRAAAVLLPVVLHEHAEPALLLTQRTSHLHDHAGQIALPGGRTDPDDDSPEATALRETVEEIGLPATHIELLGRLPTYDTATGYRITPVVGLVRPGFTLSLDAFEVAEAFEVPLSFLMDPANHQRRTLPSADGRPARAFWAIPYGSTAPDGAPGQAVERFIWGATAAMLRNFYRLLAA